MESNPKLVLENQLEILAQEKEFLELNAMESLNRRIADLMKVLAEPIPTIAVTNDEIIELAYWEYMESMGEKEEKYWQEVKQEIINL